MNLQQRIRKLERSNVVKMHEVLVRHVFPDDWEGPLPPGGDTGKVNCRPGRIT